MLPHKNGLNTPIIGDDLYGKKEKRLHLLAEFIEFLHPTTLKKMSFTVAPKVLRASLFTNIHA